MIVGLTNRQCDGKRPVCSRCKGYGYKCRWKDRNVHTIESHRLSGDATNDQSVSDGRIRDLAACKELLSSLRAKVNEEDQQRIDAVLELTTALHLKSPIASPANLKFLDLLDPFRRSSLSTHRYLGEISDVSFFNSVKGLLQSDSFDACGNKAPLESYEREAAELLDSSAGSDVESP